MQFSRETDYAVRCIYYLARVPDRVAGIEEIARSMRIPRAFLAKILQKLTRAGLVRSKRGARGGFALARAPRAIRIYDIFSLTEGPAATQNHCAVSKEICGLESFCALHPFWVKMRRDFARLLRTSSAAELGAVGRLLGVSEGKE